MHGSSGPSRLWIRVFAAPILLAAATVIGLLAALLWGAVGQYVAWVTVAAPVLVIVWVLAWVGVRRRTKKTEQFAQTLHRK
jgi:Flp pilus assembly protein TadB